MSTYMPKPREIAADWHVVDAAGKVLGRLASEVAVILQGKHKATYTPHVEMGDYVIVVNAEKVRVTGRKAETLEYDTYSRYPGGRKVYSFQEMVTKHPEKLIELAIRRMLPKNKKAKYTLGKLKVFRGPTHDHAAQRPKPLALKNA